MGARKRTKLKLIEEIVKIRAERNEVATKETTEKISKTKGWFFEKIKLITL